MNTTLNAETPLSQWLSYLERAHSKSIDLGLERVASVAKELDLLKPAPCIITVGGTNGKGTTCRMLELVLLEMGLKVGVYSSPHLLHYQERVRINNALLPEALHTASFDFIQRHKTQSLSYFEFSTLSALHLFKQHALDVVILEVGLGGRLDATNIVDSDVAVITSVDIDHTSFLGADRESIAYEKAGIFRAHAPAVIGEANIPQSMLQRAENLACQLSRRDKEWTLTENAQDWHWQGVKSQYQHLPKPAIPLANAGCALATLEMLPFTLNEELLRKVLGKVQLTGRYQTLTQEEKTQLVEKLQCHSENLAKIILDVGHNPHAAQYLAQKLAQEKAEKSPSRRIFALCGVLKDKDLNGILKPLLPVVDVWSSLTLQGERGQEATKISQALQTFGKENVPSFDDIAQALKENLAQAGKEDIFLIFGSFHTVAQVLELLDSAK